MALAGPDGSSGLIFDFTSEKDGARRVPGRSWRMDEPTELRQRATQCRTLAMTARDQFVRKELLLIAEEFDEEAEKLVRPAIELREQR